MKVEMVMPQMGESITEATVSKWRKKVGDSVKKDEVILDISTDKVDSEIPAPAAGVITEILFKEGDVVPVKTKIAIIDSAASGSVAQPTKAAEAPAAPQQPIAAPLSPNGDTHSQDSSSLKSGNGKHYTPLVKGLAEKHGLSQAELDTIQGSGEGGRINKSDLMAYIDNRSTKASTSTPAPRVESVPTPSPVKSAPPATDWSDNSDVKTIPMDAMRQAIAEHMLRSKRTSPHVYSVQEVDCSAIAKWRAANKAKFLQAEGFSLSFTPFFLEAAVKGLMHLPLLNSSIDGNKIIMKRKINLGCAVALGEGGSGGLIVPVIKNADEKNLVGIARSLNDLANRARTKKLLPDDVKGGTFTVTNPGIFGTLIGTPIINQPQVAILSLNKIQKRVVVVESEEGDSTAIRECCYITLSYDHRIIDGGVAGRFLSFVADYIGNWDKNRSLY